MHKYQKYRTAKKDESNSIALLQHQLFSQLEGMKTNSYLPRQPDPFFSQFDQNECSQPPNQRINQIILRKAKNITYTNKNKIEKMKREIKKLEEGEEDFMTGVGLFEKRTPHFIDQEPVNEDLMLKNVNSSKLTDLQELRKMIKKTQKNLRTYSHSLYKTQTSIVSAADKYGWDLGVGLAIKINKCNLDSVYSKESKPKAPTTAISGPEKIRRRTISSYSTRRNKI